MELNRLIHFFLSFAPPLSLSTHLNVHSFPRRTFETKCLAVCSDVCFRLIECVDRRPRQTAPHSSVSHVPLIGDESKSTQRNRAFSPGYRNGAATAEIASSSSTGECHLLRCVISVLFFVSFCSRFICFPIGSKPFASKRFRAMRDTASVRLI